MIKNSLKSHRRKTGQGIFPRYLGTSGLVVAASTVLLLMASACTEQNESAAEQPVFDEASIKNVWHQAKLRGVAFRAIGQEPGWLLEITNGEKILLVTDYGQNRQSLPYVEPVVYQEERRTQYVLESYGITVEIRGERCTDIMSGEEFEVSVSIIMTDRRLEGCGRALF